MTRKHPKVTNDYQNNAELVAAYDDAGDTGAAFTSEILRRGYNPPKREDVHRWELCVISDDDGCEWLAWDSVAVKR